jgi:origin recognition complex subunit 1
MLALLATDAVGADADRVLPTGLALIEPAAAAAGPVDKFSAACAQLQLSAAPASLPCRDDQKAKVMHFLENAIRSGGVGNALYISGKCLALRSLFPFDHRCESMWVACGVCFPAECPGMPGTGKTATVREVVRQLRQKHLDAGLPPFQYLEVNAMHLASPYQLYSVLWKQLSDHETNPAKALRVGTMARVFDSSR